MTAKPSGRPVAGTVVLVVDDVVVVDVDVSGSEVVVVVDEDGVAGSVVVVVEEDPAVVPLQAARRSAIAAVVRSVTGPILDPQASSLQPGVLSSC